MGRAMDQLAGIAQPKPVKVAPPTPLLHRVTTAAAMLRLSVGQFNVLRRLGIVKETVVPGGRGKRPIVRFSEESLMDAVRAMTDDTHPRVNGNGKN